MGQYNDIEFNINCQAKSGRYNILKIHSLITNLSKKKDYAYNYYFEVKEDSLSDKNGKIGRDVIFELSDERPSYIFNGILKNNDSISKVFDMIPEYFKKQGYYYIRGVTHIRSKNESGWDTAIIRYSNMIRVEIEPLTKQDSLAFTFLQDQEMPFYLLGDTYSFNAPRYLELSKTLVNEFPKSKIASWARLNLLSDAHERVRVLDNSTNNRKTKKMRKEYLKNPDPVFRERAQAIFDKIEKEGKR